MPRYVVTLTEEEQQGLKTLIQKGHRLSASQIIPYGLRDTQSSGVPENPDIP